jgi:hypothetical protein
MQGKRRGRKRWLHFSFGEKGNYCKKDGNEIESCSTIDKCSGNIINIEFSEEPDSLVGIGTSYGLGDRGVGV